MAIDGDEPGRACRSRRRSRLHPVRGCDDLPDALPLTAIVSLSAGDVITLLVKGTSTSLQISGGAGSTTVMTIASVD